MIHDLSYPIHEGMVTHAADRHARVEVWQLGRIPVEGSETRRIVLGSHTGTHVDAPRHMIPGGDTVDTMDPDVLVGDAVVSDHGVPADIPERLILRWGWKSLDEPGYYTDYPFLTEAEAQRIADGGCRLLGMDTPSPDPPSANGCHRILLGAGVILVEYLTNLAGLPEHVRLTVAPLNVVGSDGAPARVFAEAA